MMIVQQPRLKIAGIVLSLAMLITVALAYFWPNSASFPESVLKQASFAVFVPDTREVVIDEATVKYNTDEKLLAYTATIGKTTAVISEQSTPDQFTDIPAIYDKFLDTLNQYAAFEVPAGKVYLTRPPNLQGRQAAVMNEKGTLMFVKPTIDLSEKQWRELFLSFEIRK